MRIMSQSSFNSEAASIRKSKLSTNQKTIVLVGLMGAGKTVLGSKLARQMGRPFIDSDVEIERTAKMRIRDIFEYDGMLKTRYAYDQVCARPPAV